MEQLTITTKIQVLTDTNGKSSLDNIMSAYSSTCNYVADYIFRTHDLKQFSLNRALYSSLRELFSLRSQMAQSVLKTVITRYKTILENQNEQIKPDFKHPEYDPIWNRDCSLTNSCFSVNTLKGRIKLPYFSKGVGRCFSSDIYKFSAAKLVNKHEKYFLHIPVTYEVEENNLSDICDIVGIDRGISSIVATYDDRHKSGFVSGKQVKQRKTSCSRPRKELQMRQTPSSRWRLKAVGSRENRWMQDINYRVSKALVQDDPKHTLFVLEDLSGVRNSAEKIRLKDRYVSVSWSFYNLEQELIYKSEQNQSTVIKVNPACTSQTCPCCGHTEKANRNKKLHLFTCKNCGYKSNDDRVGTMSLYRMGINYLEDSQVSNTVTVE